MRRISKSNLLPLALLLHSLCIWKTIDFKYQGVHAGRALVIPRVQDTFRRRKRSKAGPVEENKASVATAYFIKQELERSWNRWVEWWSKETVMSDTSVASSATNGARDDELIEENIQVKQHDSKQIKKTKAKSKRSKPRTGRQKMESCRHLASASSPSSKILKLWRRGKRAVERRYNTWRRIVDVNGGVTTEMEENAAAFACRRDMNLAYGMAAMASLAYWPFHKKPLPDNRVSFELLTVKNGTAQPLAGRRRRKRDRVFGMALKGISTALDQASPWLPKSRRNRQNRGSYRESWKSNLQARLTKSEQFMGGNHARFHDGVYQLEFSMYNWYEPSTLGVNYHDTDLLVATSNNGNTLILAFAGTDSAPDTVTNLQTFESVQHLGGLFQSMMNSTLEGSVHRGFLNAYSRTERGSVLNLCDGQCVSMLPRSSILTQRYSHCIAESGAKGKSESMPDEKDFDQYDVLEAERQSKSKIVASSDSLEGTNETAAIPKHKAESIVRKRGRRGCKIKHQKLMTILRELVNGYLAVGKSVLLTGHSLGGSLATLLALDIVMHFPNVPVERLELWTFGGAQVADDRFLESALDAAPRLQNFLEQDHRWLRTLIRTPRKALKKATAMSRGGRSQFHRFVTVSDDCKVDFISTIAQSLLSPENEGNIHGKTARKLGGILKGGNVVHLVEPHYLLTPDQYQYFDGNDDLQKSSDGPSSTRSSLSAHVTGNYLAGISRESKDHPLTTDLPPDIRRYLGELSWS